MNKRQNTYRIVGNGLNMALLALVLIPLIALSFYNHPSAADDYCFIDTVFKYGWMEGMHHYYIGWTGRYFGILLNHSNPLIIRSVAGFKILPIVLILSFSGALYVLFRQLTPTLSRKAHAGFTGVLLFLYITKLPNIAEAFYWMAAFVTYTVPNTLTILWLVVMIRWYRLETMQMKVLTGIFAGFLTFAIMGSSEINLLVQSLLLAGWWGYRLIFQRKTDGLMAWLAAVAGLSLYLFFSAPGNEARMGGNPVSGNIPESVLYAFRKLAILSFDWIFRTPLLLLTAAWIYVLSTITPQALKHFKVPFFYMALLYTGILAAQIFPSYYAISIEVEPAPRVLNSVYLYFLLGWFYMVGAGYYWISQKRTMSTLNTMYQPVLVALLVPGLLFFMYKNQSLRTIYSDWLRGKASAYNKEMYARYDLIHASSESVVAVPALKNLPQTLFVEDIQTNPVHLWNKCTAGYFGKSAIYLIQEKDTSHELTP
ncbi:hypothetical protein [Arundinibacter roseus]|uniref:Glycosyltransferase RgtA/B/C/D-like domain-containing protein n=1 Tax=Arundinibacter roseus TaxID=2070510 RepID=A0A4R4KBI3_9BACT|nr:hypothetical protein [Arundinibacter roseus]TDB64112.1 hypothetical protein EZE20_14315 [Arundinibacter roseus]